MTQNNSHTPTSIALVAMFFLLMLGKFVTMHHVGLLGKDLVESKEILIRSSMDIENMKTKIEALESVVLERKTQGNGGAYANN